MHESKMDDLVNGASKIDPFELYKSDPWLYSKTGLFAEVCYSRDLNQLHSKFASVISIKFDVKVVWKASKGGENGDHKVPLSRKSPPVHNKRTFACHHCNVECKDCLVKHDCMLRVAHCRHWSNKPSIQ